MLGQNRDLISVRGPDCFVHWKNKTKSYTHNIRHVCIFSLFSLFGNMFAKWLLQLLLLLHNSCNIWFHAWRCNTLIASTIFKNRVYLTHHWPDSADVAAPKRRDQDFVKKPETRKFADFAEMFRNIFKRVSSPTSKLTFCELSAFFLFAYCMLFLTCTHNRQKVFQLRSGWIKQVLLSQIVAVFKVSRQ